MSSKRQSSGGAFGKQRRSSNANTVDTDTQRHVNDDNSDDELNDTQLRVLYELNAIKSILDDVNASLHALVRSTAPGGRLYESQQLALQFFGCVGASLSADNLPLAAPHFAAPIATLFSLPKKTAKKKKHQKKTKWRPTANLHCRISNNTLK
jgi:hypothetical protein